MAFIGINYRDVREDMNRLTAEFVERVYNGEGLSMATKDGGPAFPGIEIDFDETIHRPGMTLRDWFAGQALAGLVTHGRGTDALPQMAYEYADAMLAPREK